MLFLLYHFIIKIASVSIIISKKFNNIDVINTQNKLKIIGKFFIIGDTNSIFIKL